MEEPQLKQKLALTYRLILIILGANYWGLSPVAADTPGQSQAAPSWTLYALGVVQQAKIGLSVSDAKQANPQGRAAFVEAVTQFLPSLPSATQLDGMMNQAPPTPPLNARQEQAQLSLRQNPQALADLLTLIDEFRPELEQRKVDVDEARVQLFLLSDMATAPRDTGFVSRRVFGSFGQLGSLPIPPGFWTGGNPAGITRLDVAIRLNKFLSLLTQEINSNDHNRQATLRYTKKEWQKHPSTVLGLEAVIDEFKPELEGMDCNVALTKLQLSHLALK